MYICQKKAYAVKADIQERFLLSREHYQPPAAAQNEKGL